MNKKQTPRVSIIIPCFNGESYLNQAIDSALNQTYDNIEVIVVNDGSFDRTEEIALSYGDRIRYYRKNNGGVSSALNLGITKMSGEYFSWLSHDDIYVAEKIEEQIKAINGVSEDKRFVYSNYTCLIEEDNTYQNIIPASKLYGELCEMSLFPVLFNLINGCTVLIHKSLFDKCGLFDVNLSTSQDYDMWMRLLDECNPVYLEKSLVITRIHNRQGSKTIKAFSENCQRMQLDMINRISDRKINSIFKGMYKLYSDMIVLSIKNEWSLCVDELYSVFKKLDEPINYKDDKNIYIYGAGKNGKRIIKECKLKNVNVKAVIDKKSELWGQEIFGVECKSLSDIPYNSEIWVAVENDMSIKNALIEKGFFVKDFAETNVFLFGILPSKESISRMTSSYRKREGWL